MRHALGCDLKAGGLAIGAVSFPPLAYAGSVEWYAKRPKAGEHVQFMRRLAEVRDMAEVLMQRMADEFPPSAILVEDPKGRHRAPTLVAAYGAVCPVAFDIAGEGAVTMAAREWRKVLKLATVKGDPKGPGVAFARSLGAPADIGEDRLEAVAQAAAAARWLS